MTGRLANIWHIILLNLRLIANKVCPVSEDEQTAAMAERGAIHN